MRTRSSTTALADGAVRALTSGNFIHGSPVWAHDGKRVAFYGNDRDGVSHDVYIADVGAAAAAAAAGRRRQDRYQADTWYPLDWSTDDAKLLCGSYLSASESYLYIADVATGALTPLDQHADKAGIRAAKLRTRRTRGVRADRTRTASSRSCMYTDPSPTRRRASRPMMRLGRGGVRRQRRRSLPRLRR